MREIERLTKAREVLAKKCPKFPKIILVLGSGLSQLLDDMDTELEIPFSEIPFIQPSTVEGHRGVLAIGKLAGVRVGCMKGRLHYYEGYDMADVVFPFRLFALAGAQDFILTNASGGLHPNMTQDLVIIKDHINLMGTNPLIGSNEAELGTRFPDMTELYNKELRGLFRTAAQRIGLSLREGVYVAIHGPSYETPAEIKMYRSLGGDVVGMSTVPEAISLHHMGRNVVAISCVTNLAAGVGPGLLIHTEVLQNAKKSHGPFSKLILEVLKDMEKRHD